MYNYNNGENYISQKYYLIKLTVSVITSFLIFLFINIYNIKFFARKLSLNLFKLDEKDRYPSEIYLFLFELIKNLKYLNHLYLYYFH